MANDDLISRQAAIATAISGRVRALPTTEDGEDWIRVNEVRDSLLSLPSAQPDVNGRNVGKWIWMGDTGDSRWMCSVCKGKENVPTIMGKPIVWDYCPNCGARMEVKDESTLP